MKKYTICVLIVLIFCIFTGCSAEKKVNATENLEITATERVENTEEIRAVEIMIASLGEVALRKESVIVEAEAAYNNLATDDQNKVSNYLDLVSARAKLDELLEAFGKAQDAHDSIVASANISAEDAYRMIKDFDLKGSDLESFQEDLKNLLSCDGTFVLHGTRNDYPATINFYLVNGDYRFSIEYDNFRGKFKDGTVEKINEDGFLFVCKTEGVFQGNVIDFAIKVGSGSMHVQGGNEIDETLYRK